MLNRIVTYHYCPSEIYSYEFVCAVRCVLKFSLHAVECIHDELFNSMKSGVPETVPDTSVWYYESIIQILRIANEKLDNRYVSISYKETLESIFYRNSHIPKFIWLLLEAAHKIEAR